MAAVELGLLHEQYVLAGVWALLPLGATFFAFLVIAGAAREEFSEMNADPASTIASVGFWMLVKIGASVVGFAVALAICAIGGLASFVVSGTRSPVLGAVPVTLLRGMPASPHDEHRLLFATDKSYIVLDPSDPRRAIEIPTDLVVAVRTVGR